MRQVIAIQTSDGVLHLNDSDATIHAHKRYNEAMTRLRHALQNYGTGMSARDAAKALSFIEDNFDTIAEVYAIQADLIMHTLRGDDE